MQEKGYMIFVEIGIYILIGYILYKVICKIINNINKKAELNKLLKPVYKKKQQTVLNLLKNIFKYLILVIILLIILNSLGVNTTSILASLGIAGAIIGLAFQDIVKNLIAGISIIFDNHYMQGDYVTINGFEGQVIALGLQTTKIKAYTGEVMIIDNSRITEVINHSMNDSRLVLKFAVSNEISPSKIDKIISKIDKELIELKEVKNNIEIKGVEEYNVENYIYRVEIVCFPYSYFSVRRKFNELLKYEFEKNNIPVLPENIEIKIKEK